MATGYSQAISIGRDLEKEKEKGLAEAGKKTIETEAFKIDKKIEYDKVAKKAAEKFGKWQKGLGTIFSLAAIASGVGAPLAAAIAGGGSLVGGVMGQKAAQKEMAGMDWLNKEQSDLFSGMRKSTGKKALTSAVMAGITAHGAGAGGTEAGAELSKTGAKSTGGFTPGTSASGRINPTTGKMGASNVKSTGILQQGSAGTQATASSISKVAVPKVPQGTGLTYGFDAVKQHGWKGAYSNLTLGAKSLFSDDALGKLGMGNTLLDYYNAQETERQGV